MNSKNVKEVINSVVSNLVDADSQLSEYFDNGNPIEHAIILAKLKWAIGTLEDLCEGIK